MPDTRVYCNTKDRAEWNGIFTSCTTKPDVLQVRRGRRMRRLTSLVHPPIIRRPLDETAFCFGKSQAQKFVSSIGVVEVEILDRSEATRGGPNTRERLTAMVSHAIFDTEISGASYGGAQAHEPLHQSGARCPFPARHRAVTRQSLARGASRRACQPARRASRIPDQRCTLTLTFVLYGSQETSNEIETHRFVAVRPWGD